MPLAILPLLIPDIPKAYDTHFAAFASEPITSILYPHGIDRNIHKEGTIAWLHHDKIGHSIKCVDTETGEIIGMAVWEVFWRPLESFVRPEGIPWLEGEEKKRCDEVLGGMWDMRVKLFGKRRYIYLASIAVHPDHQRRGAGRLLMQWGIDTAEQLDLPIYTECSKPGLALYESIEFKRLTHVRLIHSAEVMHTEKDVEVPLVIKLPSSAKGLSIDEWLEKN